MCACGTVSASAQHKWHWMAQLLSKAGVAAQGLQLQGCH